MTDKLKLFIPITKVDAAKRLVYGTATAEVADRTNEVCDYATTKPLYEKWSADIAKATDGKSVGNLRSMHGHIAAGKLTTIAFDDAAKRIEICAKVVDDAEWNKVEEGVYTGFSQGGTYVKRWKDPDNPELTRYTADPVEVSLVDLPCLPECTFEMVKADGTKEVRKFTSVEKPADAPTISNAAVADKATELAKAAGTPDNWSQFIEAARAELTKAAAPVVAPVVGTPVAEPAADTPTNFDPEVAQVWQALDGTTHAKKADAVKANEAHRAAQAKDAADKAAKAAAAPALDVLSQITAALDKRDGKPAETPAAPEAAPAVVKSDLPDDVYWLAKKDYSDDDRKDMAANGQAMHDGSFPIKTGKDVANAVKDWGRTGSKSSVKRHIIQRAKAIGATDELPADWPGSTKKPDGAAKAARAEAVRKDLHTAARLACLIAELDWLSSGVDFEEAIEQDGSTVGATLKQQIENLCGVLREMVNEETQEISAGDDVEFFEMAAGTVPHAHFEALAKLGDKLGKAQDMVEKAGARHSKSDQDRLDQAHDLLVKAGAACGVEKGAHEAALAKVAGERDAVQKALDGLTPVLAEVLDRVKKIEAQPLTQGTPTVFSVVGKDADDALTVERLREMTPDQIATMAFKAALRQPKPIAKRGQ